MATTIHPAAAAQSGERAEGQRHRAAGVNRETVLHLAYLIGIALKGVDGLIEICAGALLLLTAKPTIVHFVAMLTRPELAQNPHSFLATHALSIAAGLSLSTQHFASAYLLFHGAIKAGLVAGLMRGWRHAYPVALVLLTVFIAYQGYRLSYHPSWVLAGFTAIDVAIAVLIAYEWRRTESTVPARSKISQPCCPPRPGDR